MKNLKKTFAETKEPIYFYTPDRLGREVALKFINSGDGDYYIKEAFTVYSPIMNVSCLTDTGMQVFTFDIMANRTSHTIRWEDIEIKEG